MNTTVPSGRAASISLSSARAYLGSVWDRVISLFASRKAKSAVCFLDAMNLSSWPFRLFQTDMSPYSAGSIDDDLARLSQKQVRTAESVISASDKVMVAVTKLRQFISLSGVDSECASRMQVRLDKAREESFSEFVTHCVLSISFGD